MADSQGFTLLQYCIGSTFAIIEFTIWPDLPKTQSLNHVIKNCPTVLPSSILKALCHDISGDCY